MTETERIVTELCKHSFLRFWTIPSPKRKKDKKELCDVLVFIHPYLIIISVKEIIIKENSTFKIQSERWERKAILDSAKQIYGAERYINKREIFYDSRFETEFQITNFENIKLFRIAIAFGRGDKFHLIQGKFEGGFVHVIDEKFLHILFKELNTITDFTEYLERKEDFFEKSRVIFTQEEDLLAIYLHNNRNFPYKADIQILNDDIWDGVKEKKEFKNKINANETSFLWDNLIDIFTSDFRNNTLIGDTDFDSTDKALRILALETRFSRRILANSFLEINKPESKIRSRIISSISGITYVFLIAPGKIQRDRDTRNRELVLRCWVARKMHKDNKIVIGIAKDPINPEGTSYDLVNLEIDSLTKEELDKIEEMQTDLGYFSKPIFTSTHIDEYPFD
ncbi:hypothetical protein AB3N62_15755 [Leptospira sp. WS4.C2]